MTAVGHVGFLWEMQRLQMMISASCKKPTSTTYRAVIGMVAALAGGNARIDENDLLRIVTYQTAPKVVELVETPWLDTKGNSICDTEGNQIIMTREDATIGLDLSEGIDDVQTDTDIITVTGVKYTEDKQDYVYGTEGYMINLKENQLLAGKRRGRCEPYRTDSGWFPDSSVFFK
ncbi:MAG: hypothetical protein ACLTER_00380 [Ruminococcus sp.]